MLPSQPNNSANTAAKGYWNVLAIVNEPSRFGNYTFTAGPLIVSHGGRVLARDDVVQVVEGSVLGRPYVIEFPSYAVALACFNSAGYQEAVSLRAGVAEFQIVVVEGLATTSSL